MDWLAVDYGEYGGNVNLRINGDCRNIANFNVLNGTDVGGVRVVVADYDVSGQGCGRLYATGPIEEFIIGGQELWIDRVRACAPATAGIIDSACGSPSPGRSVADPARAEPSEPLQPGDHDRLRAGPSRRTPASRSMSVTGRAVRTLLDGMAIGGRRELQWDGHDARRDRVPSGVYAYRLEAGGVSQTRRMIILK